MVGDKRACDGGKDGCVMNGSSTLHFKTSLGYTVDEKIERPRTAEF